MGIQLDRKSQRAIYAARMRWLRQHHGLSLRECGEALGVATSTYDGMERNDTRFRRRDLVTLAHLYGMDLEDAFPTPCAVAHT